ncbi:hypothetical protein EDB87DRAFT_744138 [Lactarius vividus]|nr:hypothetical protein EDB87DRAFT_744138 [Lactarius vividus]
MHASHVAILILAASAASPALSAPLAARDIAVVPATSDVVARGFSASIFSNVNKGTKAGKRGDLVDDVQARGFDPSIFSDVNKGTKAIRAHSNVHNPDAKEIVGIARNLIDSFSRDDLDDFVQGIARRDHDVSDSDPHGARAIPPAIGALNDFLAQHGRPNPGRIPGGIRARDLEDAFLQGIARRGHDVSDSDPHGARAVPPAIGALDEFLASHGFPRPNRLTSHIRARDLEDAFLEAISRRDVSELEPRFGFGALLKVVKAVLGSKKIARRDVTPEQLMALVSLASLPLDSLN